LVLNLFLSNKNNEQINKPIKGTSLRLFGIKRKKEEKYNNKLRIEYFIFI
jgi:hypothetical protein